MELIPIKNWETVDPNGIAVKLAERSDEAFRFGALVCDRKGRIVATGYNRHSTHPRWGSGPYKMLHAEGNALWACEKLGIKTKGLVMYIFRERQNISKPCKYCMELLKKAGISKVFYSDKNKT